MPLDVTPNTITLDKVRIEQFTVSPQLNAVMIHYSRGYNDENGQYVAKEHDRVDLKDVSFEQGLYDQAKDTLYELLATHLSQ